MLLYYISDTKTNPGQNHCYKSNYDYKYIAIILELMNIKTVIEIKT